MSNLAEVLGSAGGVWVVVELAKGTLLLVVLFAVAATLRRSSAGLRHLVWSTGIVAVLALPIASAVVPWRLDVLPALGTEAAPPEQTPAGSGEKDPNLQVRDVASATGGTEESGAVPKVSSPTPTKLGRAAAPGWRLTAGAVAVALVGLWLAGVLIVMGRLAFGSVLVRRIVRSGRPLETPDWRRPLFEVADRLELRSAPGLVVSGRMPMPFAAGLLRPVIVLPESAEGWSDRRRRAVLFHELAHVRRQDLLVNVLGRLACALYWFHPLIWMAVRRQRAESERACDDMVLAIGTRASEYADHLLQIVCRAGRASTPAIALPMAQRKEFEGRMLAILEAGARRRGPSRRTAIASAAMCLLLVVPLAAMRSAQPCGGVSQGSRASAGDAVDPMAMPTDVEGSTAAVPSPASTPETRPQPTPAVQRQPPVAASDAKGPATQVDDVPGALGDAIGEVAASAIRGLNSGPTDGAQDTVSARIVLALVRALGDSSAEVREDAAYALGQREARNATPALGKRLLEDESVKVREMSAWALGQIESKDATDALSSSARSDSAESVRAMAIWALGQVEDPASVPALSAALSDAAPEIRRRAAWALGSIEPRTAPPALIHALGDTEATVRLRAAWALGQIEDPAATPALGRLLDDSVADVRSAAMWALGQMDSEEARVPLLHALESKDPKIRAAAARALAGGGGNPWPWPWPMPIHR